MHIFCGWLIFIQSVQFSKSSHSPTKQYLFRSNLFSKESVHSILVKCFLLDCLRCGKRQEPGSFSLYPHVSDVIQDSFPWGTKFLPPVSTTVHRITKKLLPSSTRIRIHNHLTHLCVSIPLMVPEQ